MLLPAMLFGMSMLGILPSSAKADRTTPRGSWQNDSRANARNGNDHYNAHARPTMRSRATSDHIDRNNNGNARRQP